MVDKHRGIIIPALLGIAAIGAALWFMSSTTAGQPAWGIFLTNFLYFTGVTQGVLVMAVLLRLTSAKWSANFFRLSTLVALAFFPIALVMLIIIFVARGSILFWIADAEQNLWFNSYFFIARNLVPFIAFYAVAEILSKVRANRQSNSLDEVNEELALEGQRKRLVRYGSLLLFVFVIQETIMSWDLGMILTHGFADTAYAPLFITGSIYSGAAAIVLLMLVAMKVFKSVSFNETHFKNMGQLLLGLGIFWIYVWYIQFFNIYFVNLPEETAPFYLRIFGGYGAIYVAALLLAGAVPFLLLVVTRIRDTVMGVSLASGSILLGMWLDRYLIAIPSLVEHKKTAVLSFINPTNFWFSAGILSVFLLFLLTTLGRSENVIYADETELEKDSLITEPMGWQ